MIPNAKDSVLVTGGVTASSTFGISLQDAPHLMTILSSTLYTDKVMAVLREYSANAWDAHREANKPDLPILVTLPTSMSPTLVIRDYGLGLTSDDVFQIYTQYGASTKRRSNNAVGMLGIGSKAGFAYSDSFTITSWCEGLKTIYAAVKTPAGIYEIKQLHQEACSAEESGIEIQIAAKPNDIMEFHNKAKNLYRYYEPRPTINTELPPSPVDATKLKHGTLIKGTAFGWTAVMGCVPYKIDVTQIQAANNDGAGVPEYVGKISGVLNFDIGSVQISASREGLEYTPFTKQALIEKFGLAVDEYVQYTLDNITKKTMPSWTKRLQAQVLTALKMPIPKKHKELISEHANLKKKPKLCTISRMSNIVESITIGDRQRLIYRDDKRELSGYRLDYHHDYVVEKIDDAATWDDVQKEVEKVLEASDLDGMPSIKISSLIWYPPPAAYGHGRQRNKVKNPKHQAKIFRYLPDQHSNRSSDDWELVTRTPNKKDVFCIIERFDTVGYSLHHEYRQDRKLAKILGGTLPEVYGYKNTLKKPIAEKDCVGTEYRKWSEKFIKGLFTKRIEALYNHWEWSQSANNEHARSPNKTDYEKVKAKLGKDHEITKLFQKQQAGAAVVADMQLHKKELLAEMEQFRDRLFSDKQPAYEKHIERVLVKYPLLEIYELDVLWGEFSDEWVAYIKLVDKA